MGCQEEGYTGGHLEHGKLLHYLLETWVNRLVRVGRAFQLPSPSARPVRTDNAIRAVRGLTGGCNE